MYVASRGWTVTALDSSQVAIDELPGSIDARCIDLESPHFQIAPDAYDLICTALASRKFALDSKPAAAS